MGGRADVTAIEEQKRQGGAGMAAGWSNLDCIERRNPFTRYLLMDLTNHHIDNKVKRQ
jgi:hypothetical protein